MKKIRQLRGKYLMPSYNELTVFIMAVVFAALLGADGTLRRDLFQMPSGGGLDPEAFIWLLVFVVMFVGGFALSLYHVFTSRRKNMLEKSMMLAFAGITNAIAGIAGAVHVIESSSNSWLIFPILNIIGSVVLLYLLALSDESKLEDEDATLLQVAVGTVTSLAIFAVSRFVYDLYWAVTFSICVFYATFVVDVLLDLLRLSGRQTLPSRPQDETPITEILSCKWMTLTDSIAIKLGRRKPEE